MSIQLKELMSVVFEGDSCCGIGLNGRGGPSQPQKREETHVLENTTLHRAIKKIA